MYRATADQELYSGTRLGYQRKIILDLCIAVTLILVLESQLKQGAAQHMAHHTKKNLLHSDRLELVTVPDSIAKRIRSSHI